MSILDVSNKKLTQIDSKGGQPMKNLILVLAVLLVASIYTLLISEAQATTLEIHEIIYEDHNGIVVHQDYFATGANLTEYIYPVAPAREGYLFIGWSYTLPDEMPDADIIIVANYLQTEVKIITTV